MLFGMIVVPIGFRILKATAPYGWNHILLPIAIIITSLLSPASRRQRQTSSPPRRRDLESRFPGQDVSPRGRTGFDVNAEVRVPSDRRHSSSEDGIANAVWLSSNPLVANPRAPGAPDAHSPERHGQTVRRRLAMCRGDAGP